MIWTVTGIVASALLAVLAFFRSRAPGGFYDTDVYGMTARTHRAYGGIALLFLAAFCFTGLVGAGTITLWIFTAFVLFALFYLTSFLRGAHEDDG